MGELPPQRRRVEGDEHHEADHDREHDGSGVEVDDGAGERSHDGEEREVDHPQPIRLGSRILFVGNTGMGKSEGELNLFAAHGGQRLLIDPQDHYVLGPAALAEDPPPLEIDDPRELDWQHRTCRYVPRRAGDRNEMDRLHGAIFRRGNLLVCGDEMEDIAPSQGGGAPFYVRKCLKQGRKVRITYAGATQRPVGVERSFINQAEHLFAFQMIDPEDLKVISYRLGMSVHELSHELNQLGQYEYLRHDLGVIGEDGKPVVIRMPALPAETIAFTRQHVVNFEHRPT